MKALVDAIYSAYPGLVSFRLLSSSVTPDTFLSKKLMITGLKTDHQALPVARAIR